MFVIDLFLVLAELRRPREMLKRGGRRRALDSGASSIKRGGRRRAFNSGAGSMGMPLNENAVD